MHRKIEGAVENGSAHCVPAQFQYRNIVPAYVVSSTTRGQASVPGLLQYYCISLHQHVFYIYCMFSIDLQRIKIALQYINLPHGIVSERRGHPRAG